jgi:hypothetical protein
MKKTNLTLLVFLFLALSQIVFAQETFEDKASGVQITVPAGWYYEAGEKDLTIYSPNKELGIILTVKEFKEIDKALDQLVKDLQDGFKNIDMGKPEESETNGMPTLTLAGTAKNSNDVDVVIVYSLILTPKEKILELGAVGTPETIKKYEKQIDEIDKSLKPLK